jgi:antitoxin MazE
MELRVQKWGGNLILRIPELLADEIGIKEDSPVQLSLSDKRLVIIPVVKPALSLDTLLEQVTERNLHREVDTGPIVGGEVW